ncbi:MAG: activator of HSP90 ATPase 1 family protein [uncultured bacterium]|uniref:Activator of Hsp90 ATPase 1 family protein n=4 Tax=Candidatus Daviesiibacteriota TaxID=1752718 RepID=A0A0G0HEG5_9BACT|nr:MAG: activator of HSP90 ATPase 1 family protein [uncultured bacterium]KKQ10509.1 MAG: Activator of Hsp90 ATPase 1 family protein [Candidatus Daviesbacteria bacterium GW2011_GWB1_36_5]KKQ14933.1 MAG: Activator of Hsp90 ATPase 1 family protein [Candidatus Daviesbacteria bacterium GW2011_GWA1_36_8]OGE17229.1 MAG: hypothetical protein A2858_00805 [Candidatus Daviesbacteria bacterium RIFCSPHIGHO2_01_FULL_36_37]OGE36010.1 MAG: hypothetical protein A3E66_01800 [Candidatus Daviesbacteria bacterium R
MKKLQQKHTVKANINEVWQALVDPKVIESWGGGPAKMSDEEGFEFELWGGDIKGKNLMVLEHKKIVQEWYGGKWKKPSIVTFSLASDGDKVEIELIHEDIPDEEFEKIEEGWKESFLGPLKKLLEK